MASVVSIIESNENTNLRREIIVSPNKASVYELMCVVLAPEGGYVKPR